MTKGRKKKGKKTRARKGPSAAAAAVPSATSAAAPAPAVPAVQRTAPAPVPEDLPSLLARLAQLRATQRLRVPPLKGEGHPPADAALHHFKLFPHRGTLVPLALKELPPGFRMPLGLVREGEGHLGRGDVAAALAVSRRLMEGQPAAVAGNQPSPRAVDALTLAARAYLLEGRTQEARDALGVWAEHPDFCLARAFIALSDGEAELAQRMLERALAANPEGLAETYALAMFKASVGENREAMALLGRVAAHVPEHAVARHLLGKLTAEEGDPARAGTLFEQAWESAPGFVAPALTLAEMFTEARQYGEAMNILNQAAERAPSLLAPRMMQLRILVDARRVAAAIPLAEALHQAAPTREDVSLLWADALILAERGAEVRTELRRQVAEGSLRAHGRIHMTMARAAMAQQPPDAQGARRHLEDAVSDPSPQAEWLLELAQVQAQQKDLEAARKSLERLENLEELELTAVVNAAVAATRHGFPDISRRLAKLAMEHVRGTPAETQVRAILSAL